MQSPVAPCSLAANADSIVFHDGQKLVCLDRRTGKTRWEAEETPLKMPVHSNTGPRVLIYEDMVLLAANDGKVSGWTLDDGKKVWENRQKPSGHMSLKDLFVVDGLAWTAAIAGNRDDGVWTGYDPKTGEKQARVRAGRATALVSPSLLSVEGEREVSDHGPQRHRVRGPGQRALDAQPLVPRRLHLRRDALQRDDLRLDGRLRLPVGGQAQRVQGPFAGTRAAAFARRTCRRSPAWNAARPTGRAQGPSAGRGRLADLPARPGTQRRRIERSLKDAGDNWETHLGGRLTQPTVAAGKLFVASRDTHTLHALDADTGKPLWSYTTGGQTDTPPTYWNGLVVFGSADGYVYALRADDGVLAWRFRAAPVDQRMMAWERIESAWPVHGSVLVREDDKGQAVIYCTAGRSIYLDGGIRFLRLEAATGKLLGEVVWNESDPESGESMHNAYLKKTPATPCRSAFRTSCRATEETSGCVRRRSISRGNVPR